MHPDDPRPATAACRLEQLAAQHKAELESAAEQQQQAVQAVQAEMQGRVQAVEEQKAALDQQAEDLQERLVKWVQAGGRLGRLAALGLGLRLACMCGGTQSAGFGDRCGRVGCAGPRAAC
jgi:hypothetical protein